MKYVIETSAGFISHGTEKPAFASAQVFASHTAAATARDQAASNGFPGTLVSHKDALAKAQSNQALKSAPTYGF
jgi:hypothetical protein